MTHETFPAPIEPTDPSQITGDQVNGPDAQAEQFLHGAAMLAVSVGKIAELGQPDAVGSYLNDLLADTTGRVDPAERAAAFQLMATEQRNEIRNGLIVKGDNLLTKLENNNRSVTQTLASERPPALSRSLQAYEQTVGSPLRRGQFDKRIIIRAHENIQPIIRGEVAGVQSYARNISEWSSAQHKQARGYEDDVDNGSRHERALSEATETLAPNYDGELKDLSSAIGDRIKRQIADKLQTAVSEPSDGRSSAEIVAELVSREADGQSHAKVVALYRFSKELADSMAVGGKIVQGGLADTQARLAGFAGRGADRYSQARRPEDFNDAYRSQHRVLGEAQDVVALMARRGQSVLASSSEQVASIRIRLSLPRAA